jgi:hypothetical protein
MMKKLVFIITLALASLFSATTMAQVSVEDRLKALETKVSTIEKQVGIETPDPAPVEIPVDTGATVVNSLDEIKGPGNYRLKVGKYTITKPFDIKSDTTLDVTGSEFVYTGGDWTSLFDINGDKNITVIGGSYFTGRWSYITQTIYSSNITIKNQTLLPGSGWAYAVSGGENITFDGLTATTWYNYLIFGQGNAKNVIIQNWKVDGGSENESAIRVCGIDGLIIRNSHLFADLNPKGARKNTALRLHEGSDYLVENVELRGNFGIGPMGGGDGGQQWGTTTWIGKDGKWYAAEKDADVKATLEQRAKVLALRTIKVRINNVRIIEGKVQANPGLIDCVWNGGSITNSTKAEQPNWPAANWCFYGFFAQYPDGSTYAKLLDGDVVRPKAQITINNLALNGSLSDSDNYVNVGTGVTLNGRPIK